MKRLLALGFVALLVFLAVRKAGTMIDSAESHRNAQIERAMKSGDL